MDTNLETREKEELIKVVNEDWPMLEELGKKRFVINKNKKNKDVQSSITALQAVIDEEEQLENHEIKKVIVDVTNIETANKKVAENVIKVEDEKIVVAKEVVTTPSSQTEKLATTISQSTFVDNVKNQQVKEDFVETPKIIHKEQVNKIVKDELNENNMALIKLVLAGFTHLYVSKTTNLLVPLRFVMKHYKEVLVASMYILMPFLMTYYMTTEVKFVSEQLIKETIFMKSVYYGVFFLGSTFVWITGQVLLSGLFAMIRKSMIDVAKIGKQNQ